MAVMYSRMALRSISLRLCEWWCEHRHEVPTRTRPRKGCWRL